MPVFFSASQLLDFLSSFLASFCLPSSDICIFNMAQTLCPMRHALCHFQLLALKPASFPASQPICHELPTVNYEL
jgi:hypothetical protein